MPALDAFPITRRWPAVHPDRIPLCSLPTPNGIKVSAALEDLGLPCEAHKVSFSAEDQTRPEFLSLPPNGKIPAIIDPDGPGGRPTGHFVTFAADRAKIPTRPSARSRNRAAGSGCSGDGQPTGPASWAPTMPSPTARSGPGCGR